MLIVLTLLLCLLGTAPTLLAGEDPSVAVVVVSSYDKLMEHTSVVGEIVGFPNLQQMLDLQLLQLTGGKPLEGLDRNQPIVIDVKLGKNEPYFIACLPVTSLEELLGSLPDSVATTEDVGDGVLQLKDKAAAEPMYVKEGKGWSYWAEQKQHLADVADDPVQLAGDLPTSYVIGARASLQNIPPNKRDEVIGFLELMVKMQMAGVPNQDAQIDAMNQQIKQLRNWVDETKDLTVGVGLDKEEKSAHLDFIMTAMSGSELEKSYARLKKGKSDHAGFLHEDATIAMAINLSGKPVEEDVKLLDTQQKMLHAQMLENIDSENDFSGEQKETIKGAAGKLIDVFFDTLRSENFQAGIAAMINEHSTLILGALVTDGNAVEEAIKQLVEMASEQTDIPGPDWEAENHGFYRIHTWKTEIPDQAVKKMFGDELELAIGVNATSIYFAIGGNGIADLKQTIDAAAKASDQAIDPLEARIKLGPLMRVAAAQEDGSQFAPLAGILEEKDEILYTVEPVPGGVRTRITFEQNVLRAIPLIGMTMGSSQP
jgi:hypothetical protein